MLYFAYGSNLSLQQMAGRCPHSLLIGRAILADYRWQINERGFANVVRHSGSLVHGLVYSIDAADEARLDRSEGVGVGSYSKAYSELFLYPAAPDLQKQPGLVSRTLDTYRLNNTRPPEQLLKAVPRALVYLSTIYVNDGQPRAEYIHRINTGIRDAVALGVPLDFFKNFVRPLVPDVPSHRRSPRPDQPLPAATSRARRSPGADKRPASQLQAATELPSRTRSLRMPDDSHTCQNRPDHHYRRPPFRSPSVPPRWPLKTSLKVDGAYIIVEGDMSSQPQGYDDYPPRI